MGEPRRQEATSEAGLGYPVPSMNEVLNPSEPNSATSVPLAPLRKGGIGTDFREGLLARQQVYPAAPVSYEEGQDVFISRLGTGGGSHLWGFGLS